MRYFINTRYFDDDQVCDKWVEVDKACYDNNFKILYQHAQGTANPEDYMKFIRERVLKEATS